jgi:hypothetical protein
MTNGVMTYGNDIARETVQENRKLAGICATECYKFVQSRSLKEPIPGVEEI